MIGKQNNYNFWE